MATAYPGALDTSGSQLRTDIASTDDLDDSGKEHDVMHVNVHGATIALETKLGLTDSNAVDGAILVGTAASTTAWTTSPSINITGNASGTAATVTGAAQTNITSVGTLSALAVTGAVTAGSVVAPLVIVDEDNTHSFNAADAGKMFTFSGSSGATTITLPQDSATTFAEGTQIMWVRYHTSNAVTFAAGTGATVISKDSNLSIDGQYAVAVTVKTDANEWLIFGALA